MAIHAAFESVRMAETRTWMPCRDIKDVKYPLDWINRKTWLRICERNRKCILRLLHNLKIIVINLIRVLKINPPLRNLFIFHFHPERFKWTFRKFLIAEIGESACMHTPRMFVKELCTAAVVFGNICQWIAAFHRMWVIRMHNKVQHESIFNPQYLQWKVYSIYCWNYELLFCT